MPSRPTLAAARRRLLARMLAHMRRFVDRITVDPPRERDERRAEELAKERGWHDVRRLRRQR